MAELSLDQLCERILQIKSAKATQDRLLEELNQQVLTQLQELGVHSLTTEGGKKITRVTSSTKEWDLTVLKDILLPLGLWAQVIVTKEELDRAALEHLLDRELVSQEELQPALSEKQRKPYPKIT